MSSERRKRLSVEPGGSGLAGERGFVLSGYDQVGYGGGGVSESDRMVWQTADGEGAGGYEGQEAGLEVVVFYWIGRGRLGKRLLLFWRVGRDAMSS